MSISAFKGPIVSYGSQPNADTSEWEGPDVHNAGSMLQDPRGYTKYAGGNWLCGWFQSGRGYLTVDASNIGTANATCIAASASSSATVVLASANNTTSQIVVNATGINVSSGAAFSGALAIACPDATATSMFLAFGQSGSNGTAGVNVWDPTRTAARNVTLTSAGTGNSGVVATITGRDIYGVPVVEQITATTATTAVVGTKAFKYITSITLDNATAGAISFGLGTLCGLPIRCDHASYITAFHLNTSLTAVTAAVTSSATATTGDVRGTIITTPNGTSRVTVFQAVPASAMVALSTGTITGIVGVAQYGG